MFHIVRARLGAPLRRPGSPGFTLIEILIVISIIAILASMTLVVVSEITERTSISSASMEVTNFDDGLEQYLFDEKVPPASDKETDEETNHFPDLFRALYGTPRPNGPGGRSSPYIKVEADRIAVEDPETETGFRPATLSERRDDSLDKYYLDPWGNPYIYRSNKGRSPQAWMMNRNADIYSKGPDGVDQTVLGSDEENDDIGNW